MTDLSPDHFDGLIDRFADLHVLVVGDLMLDEFVWGKVSRISPEAPVPVVEVQSSSYYPGGAANVVRNLSPFTRRTAIVGAVGADPFGERLRDLLREGGSDISGVIDARDRVTGHKMRIIGRQQQMVRVDRETVGPLHPDDRERLADSLRREIAACDAVIIEDYGKGLVDQALVDVAVAEARRLGKVLTVDLNPKNPLDWRGATAVKPNRSEALACAGIEDDGTAAAVERAAAILQARWDTGHLLVTLGEEGMLLFSRGEKPYHTPTRAQKVFDVSGAGDTAIALFTLALAAGGCGIAAAELSNHAAGIVVGKLGTATLTPEELRASFRP